MNSNEKTISIGAEVASALGTRPGKVFSSSDLMKFHVANPWCSPITLAGPVEVFDFTVGYDPKRTLLCPYGIGRYDEDRRGMYETALFKSGSEPRTVHVGLDIGAAAGTPVFAPVEAEVWGTEYLPSAGDYGGTLILRCRFDGRSVLYMLFGHLSKSSVVRWRKGDLVPKGGLLAWLGEKSENGGWNPHLHWQLSWLEPMKVDLPGAVTARDRKVACEIFPDPTPLLRVALGGWN